MVQPDSYDADMARRHIWARWQAMCAKQVLEQEHHETLAKRAKVLLEAGITLIPSEHLRDNEFVVSQDLFEAARLVMEGRA